MARNKPRGRNDRRNQVRNGQNRGQNRDPRFYQRAQTNVELQDQSQVNTLQQQLQDAQRDYLRMSQAGQSIGEGTADLLRETPRPQFDRIGSEYNAALGSVAPMFEGVAGMPSAEVDAAQALGQAIGGSGASMLANLDAREGLARSSVGRQNALATEYRQDNIVQRMEDALRGYNDQLGQVRADDPWQVSQEVQTLKDQALQERLARSKMESDAAFSKWLQGYLGSTGGSGRPGGGGGGGGGNQGPGMVPNDSGPGQMPDYPQFQGSPRANTDPMAEPARPNAGIVQDVRQASDVSELPGWVRYAFNREGAQSLQDPARQQLYRRKLRPILRQPRFQPADIAPTGLGGVASGHTWG